MNVQAVMAEPTDLPAAGAAQAEGQAPQGAQFEEFLAHATPREEPADLDGDDGASRDAEAQVAVHASSAPMAPNSRVLSLGESLARGLQKAIGGSLRGPNMQAQQPSAPASPDGGLPADVPRDQVPALIESPTTGDPTVQQAGLAVSNPEVALKPAGVDLEAVPGVLAVPRSVEPRPEGLAAPVPAEPRPEVLAAPVPVVPRPEGLVAPVSDKLATPASSSEVVREAPALPPLTADPPERLHSEVAANAASSQVSSTDSGMASGSDSGAEDAALHQQPPHTDAGARPPVAPAHDFAAALGGRMEAQSNAVPSPAPTQAGPVEVASVAAVPPSPSSTAPVAAAGAPEEVLPVHVEWLAARQGGNARISLHPPELGELELMVKVRGNAVEIMIRAHEPAAQAAAVQSRELLVEALTGRELHLDQFDVRGLRTDLGDEDPPGRTNAQAQRDADARRGAENRERAEGRPSSASLASSEPEPELRTPPPADIHTAVDLLA